MDSGGSSSSSRMSWAYPLLALAFPAAAAAVLLWQGDWGDASSRSSSSPGGEDGAMGRQSGAHTGGRRNGNNRRDSSFRSKYTIVEAGSSNSMKGAVTEQVGAGAITTLGLEQPLVIAMVGLPARGKSYLVKMIRRYLRWIGFETDVFNVGNYRRKIGLAGADSSFFSPGNTEAARVREDMAAAVQDDMYDWLLHGEEEGEEGGAIARPRRSKARVAIFDATNTTVARRLALSKRARQKGCELVFVESICDDEEVLKRNYELKLQNEDYRGMDPDAAREDFMSRVRAYERAYECIEDNEDEGQIKYLKLINVGQKTITRGCSGYLMSQLTFYLQNVHIEPRRIYFALEVENATEATGNGSSNAAPGAATNPTDITELGRQFALDLANYFEARRVPNPKKLGDQYILLTSTSESSSITAGHLRRLFPSSSYSTALLNDRRAGSAHSSSSSSTSKGPSANEDPLAFRNEGGESYLDIIERTRPIVIELERQRKNVIVICRKAVLRCIYAYFTGAEQSKIPSLRFKPHHIYELTPGPFGCTAREINPCVEY